MNIFIMQNKGNQYSMSKSQSQTTTFKTHEQLSHNSPSASGKASDGGLGGGRGYRFDVTTKVHVEPVQGHAKGSQNIQGSKGHQGASAAKGSQGSQASKGSQGSHAKGK
jgi:hypothetical protein